MTEKMNVRWNKWNRKQEKSYANAYYLIVSLNDKKNKRCELKKKT